MPLVVHVPALPDECRGNRCSVGPRRDAGGGSGARAADAAAAVAVDVEPQRSRQPHSEPAAAPAAPAVHPLPGAGHPRMVACQ
jgi:hypothetical protein